MWVAKKCKMSKILKKKRPVLADSGKVPGIFDALRGYVRLIGCVGALERSFVKRMLDDLYQQ